MVSAISLVPNKFSFLLRVKNVDDFRVLLFVIISLVTIKSSVALRHMLVNSSLLTQEVKMRMPSCLSPLYTSWLNVGSYFLMLFGSGCTAGDTYEYFCRVTSRDEFLSRFRIDDTDIKRGANTLFGTKLNLTIFVDLRGRPP